MESEREAMQGEGQAAETASVDEPEAEQKSQGGGQTPARPGGFAVGVFLGLLTGAGLATLFTPFSGQEVRQRTAEKAPDLWRRREELAREATQTVRSRLDEAMEAGREAAREAQEESRRRFERLTARRPDGAP